MLLDELDHELLLLADPSILFLRADYCPTRCDSSLTTHLALVALANGTLQLFTVVQTFYYFVLASLWPTTIQVGLLNMELVHTLHTTILLLLLVMSSLFSYQLMCLYLMSSCVRH